MDLYSPEYFMQDGTIVDPFTRFQDGLILAYGKTYDPVIKAYTTDACINLTKFVEDNGTFEFSEETNPVETMTTELLALDQNVLASYFVHNAVVPPERWWTTTEDLVENTRLSALWLNKYSAPSYWNITNSVRNVLWTRNKNADAYTLASVGNVTKPQNSIAFVNGLAFKPTVNGSEVKFEGVKKYMDAIGKHHDVDRGVVIMDFTPVGGCQFYDLASLSGDKCAFTLPEEIDEEKQSILLFVGGRFLLPSEWMLVSHNIVIDVSIWSALYELDRKYASAEFKENTRIVEASTTKDIRSLPNSFICVVNKPNLQVYKHTPTDNTKTEKLRPYGVSPKAIRYRNIYASSARGLMYDLVTKSVTDYTRSTQSSTFYAAETGVLQTKHVSVTYTSLSRPLVLFAKNRDNLMSARGCAFDGLKIGSTDIIVWPKYVILDFVFRG